MASQYSYIILLIWNTTCSNTCAATQIPCNATMHEERCLRAGDLLPKHDCTLCQGITPALLHPSLIAALSSIMCQQCNWNKCRHNHITSSMQACVLTTHIQYANCIIQLRGIGPCHLQSSVTSDFIEYFQPNSRPGLHLVRLSDIHCTNRQYK